MGMTIDMDKFLNYILTLLLKRVKVVYRKYWTSKQISQIDAIIWKLNNIENFR
jgi:hypothetical protein